MNKENFPEFSFDKDEVFRRQAYYSTHVLYLGEWLPENQPRRHAESLHTTRKKALDYQNGMWQKGFHKARPVFVAEETYRFLRHAGGNLFVRDLKEDDAYRQAGTRTRTQKSLDVPFMLGLDER
jgi:hypothetical protein